MKTTTKTDRKLAKFKVEQHSLMLLVLLYWRFPYLRISLLSDSEIFEAGLECGSTPEVKSPKQEVG